MVYAAATGVIIYRKPEQKSNTNRAHHVWLDEWNSWLYLWDKQTTGYLLFQQDPESFPQNTDKLNLIPCEIDSYCIQFGELLDMKLSYHTQ